MRRRTIVSGLAISISALGGCSVSWGPSTTDTGPSEDPETTLTRTPPPTDNENLEDLVVFNDRGDVITATTAIQPDADDTAPFDETIELTPGTKESFDEVEALEASGIVRITLNDDSWEHAWDDRDAALAIRIEEDAVTFTRWTA